MVQDFFRDNDVNSVVWYATTCGQDKNGETPNCKHIDLCPNNCGLEVKRPDEDKKQPRFLVRADDIVRDILREVE